MYADKIVGDARLAQDLLITSRFNSAVAATLNTNLQFAQRARRSVQTARLSLDSAKSVAKAARPEKKNDARVDVEKAEDEFVAAVEEAMQVFHAALDSPEPLRNLADLAKAQLQFHKEATNILSEVVPEIEQLQTIQETHFRNSRNDS